MDCDISQQLENLRLIKNSSLLYKCISTRVYNYFKCSVSLCSANNRGWKIQTELTLKVISSVDFFKYFLLRVSNRKETEPYELQCNSKEKLFDLGGIRNHGEIQNHDLWTRSLLLYRGPHVWSPNTQKEILGFIFSTPN